MGSLGAFQLVLHGTATQPVYMENGPREYDPDYNRVMRKVKVRNGGVTNLVFDWVSLLPMTPCLLRLDGRQDRPRLGGHGA